MTPPTVSGMAYITTYLTAIEHAATNDMASASEVLTGHLTDDEAARKWVWGLAGAAPMMAAHGLRQIHGDNTPPGGVWSIKNVPGIRIDRATDPHTLAAFHAVVEHLNHPDGAGTEPALDIVTAHYRQHGTEGVVRIVVELVKYGGFLWREGAFSHGRRR